MIDEPIQHDDGDDAALAALGPRLRADAAAWHAPAPPGLHQRTMAAVAAEPAHGADIIASPRPWRARRGLALAAACVALLLTAWAALHLHSPLSGADSADGERVVLGPSGDRPAGADSEAGDAGTGQEPAAVLPGPLNDLLAAASLDRELLALKADARTVTDLVSRQVRLMSGQER